MYQPPPITNYTTLLGLLCQREHGILPPSELDHEVHLYRGLSLAQDRVIPNGETAGGDPKDIHVSHPTDTAGMVRQQGMGEGMPGRETFGADPYIEYTFNVDWASQFSSLTSRHRGRLIKISIKLRYLAVPNPTIDTGREEGVFCASAAPMQQLGLWP